MSNYTSIYSTSLGAKVQSQYFTDFLCRCSETPFAVSWPWNADVQMLHCSAVKEYSAFVKLVSHADLQMLLESPEYSIVLIQGSKTPRIILQY